MSNELFQKYLSQNNFKKEIGEINNPLVDSKRVEDFFIAHPMSDELLSEIEDILSKEKLLDGLVLLGHLGWTKTQKSTVLPACFQAIFFKREWSKLKNPFVPAGRPPTVRDVLSTD